MVNIIAETKAIFSGTSERSLPDKIRWLVIMCVTTLVAGGGLMMYSGNDAVAIGMERKNGMLTAEQVQLSFDSVSGRIIRIAVREGDYVQAGDVIMQLDSTDIDLSAAQLKAQLAQLEAQIDGKQAEMNLGMARAEVDLAQTRRNIDQQKAAIWRAEAVCENRLTDYNRKAELLAVGAISRAEMDLAERDLTVARAEAAAEQQKLEQLLAGATDSGDTDDIELPAVELLRQESRNLQYAVEELLQRKNQLLTELHQLEVQKNRLLLIAPEDGKIINIVRKAGEMAEGNVPVVLLESSRQYYDIYLSEEQAAQLREGDALLGHCIGSGRQIRGHIQFINNAPGFADLKMSRERGQADLSAFQIRIAVDEAERAYVKPGMTMEVKL